MSLDQRGRAVAELLDEREQLGGILRAYLWILLEQLGDEIADRGTGLGGERGEPIRWLAQVQQDHRHLVVILADERRPPGDQREQATAERVDIRRRRNLRALALLGRHVLRRAEHRALARRAFLRRVLDEPRDA